METNKYNMLLKRIAARTFDLILSTFISTPLYFNLFSKIEVSGILKTIISFPGIIFIIYSIWAISAINISQGFTIGESVMKIRYVDSAGQGMKKEKILAKEILSAFLILLPLIWLPWMGVGALAFLMPVSFTNGKIVLVVDMIFDGEYQMILWAKADQINS